LRKIGGVLASLLGILLTSIVDVFGNTDQSRGYFPHKSHVQIAVGDLLALFSAILYGLYATLMKKRAGNEARINVLLFFGFVGIFSMIILSPGFFILHYTGVENFELPPTRKITTIVLVSGNSKRGSSYMR
jgi:solute carrier family 35, member F5